MKLQDTLTAQNWMKHTFGSDGRGCLMYHIYARRMESGRWSGAWEEHERIKRAIAYLFPERCGDESRNPIVAKFNDHPETTFEDIRRVVKLAESFT